MGVLEPFVRKRLIVHGAGRFRIERKLELAVPVELVARAGKLVVAVARARPLARYVGGMGRDLIGDDPAFTSSRSGRPRCSLGVT